jgi:hypothetical protein
MHGWFRGLVGWVGALWRGTSVRATASGPRRLSRASAGCECGRLGGGGWVGRQRPARPWRGQPEAHHRPVICRANGATAGLRWDGWTGGWVWLPVAERYEAS